MDDAAATTGQLVGPGVPSPIADAEGPGAGEGLGRAKAATPTIAGRAPEVQASVPPSPAETPVQAAPPEVHPAAAVRGPWPMEGLPLEASRVAGLGPPAVTQ